MQGPAPILGYCTIERNRVARRWGDILTGRQLAVAEPRRFKAAILQGLATGGAGLQGQQRAGEEKVSHRAGCSGSGGQVEHATRCLLLVERCLLIARITIKKADSYG